MACPRSLAKRFAKGRRREPRPRRLRVRVLPARRGQGRPVAGRGAGAADSEGLVRAARPGRGQGRRRPQGRPHGARVARHDRRGREPERHRERRAPRPPPATPAIRPGCRRCRVAATGSPSPLRAPPPSPRWCSPSCPSAASVPTRRITWAWGWPTPLIGALTGLAHVTVRPTGAVAHYAHEHVAPLVAAEAPGADAVLDGTVAPAGPPDEDLRAARPSSSRSRELGRALRGGGRGRLRVHDRIAGQVAAALAREARPATRGGSAAAAPSGIRRLGDLPARSVLLGAAGHRRRVQGARLLRRGGVARDGVGGAARRTRRHPRHAGAGRSRAAESGPGAWRESVRRRPSSATPLFPTPTWPVPGSRSTATGPGRRRAWPSSAPASLGLPDLHHWTAFVLTLMGELGPAADALARARETDPFLGGGPRPQGLSPRRGGGGRAGAAHRAPGDRAPRRPLLRPSGASAWPSCASAVTTKPSRRSRGPSTRRPAVR
jgi:hypothetical protein